MWTISSRVGLGIILCCSLAWSVPRSLQRITVPADGVPWQFPASSRTIAVGDLHGDPEALATILQYVGFMDSRGNWTGGNGRLVLMGDLLDRGQDSRAVLDLVLALSKRAQAAGGAVHVLVGNHEQLLLEHDGRYADPKDYTAFQDFALPKEWLEKQIQFRRESLASHLGRRPTPAELRRLRANETHRWLLEGLFNAMTDPKSPYAQELATRNTILQIGDTLFVHAGLEDWAIDATFDGIARVNSTVRRQIRIRQGWPRKESDDEGEWVLRDWGPTRTRLMSDNEYPPEKLERALAGLGSSRIVVGHTPTPTSTIEMSYGRKLIRIDTSISSAYPDGQLSALEIDAQGQLVRHDRIPRPKHVELPSGIQTSRNFRQPSRLNPHDKKAVIVDCYLQLHPHLQVSTP